MSRGQQLFSKGECSLEGCFKPAYCKSYCKAHYNKLWLYGDVRYNGRLSRRKPIEYRIDQHTNCFECTSHVIDVNGYVEYQFNSKKVRIHRYIYEECFGEIPAGKVIRHTCDNRACINPEHLIIGTHLDNMADMTSRGRQCKGEASPNAKLTESDVREIRKLLEQGETQTDIAKRFNVSRTVIRGIKLGNIWTHVN